MKRCLTALTLAIPLAAQGELIVVEDRGGVSALPYYQALNLLPVQNGSPLVTLPPIRITAYSEADMLPVKSEKLTPGSVAARVLSAPGLQPLFLIGDDASSREWLAQRGNVLRELQAVGLVVNVVSPAALDDLRQLAGGLQIAPTSGDQLAELLGLEHYPVLITATGLEQ